RRPACLGPLYGLFARGGWCRPGLAHTLLALPFVPIVRRRAARVGPGAGVRGGGARRGSVEGAVADDPAAHGPTLVPAAVLAFTKMRVDRHCYPPARAGAPDRTGCPKPARGRNLRPPGPSPRGRNPCQRSPRVFRG